MAQSKDIVTCAKILGSPLRLAHLTQAGQILKQFFSNRKVTVLEISAGNCYPSTIICAQMIPVITCWICVDDRLIIKHPSVLDGDVNLMSYDQCNSTDAITSYGNNADILLWIVTNDNMNEISSFIYQKKTSKKWIVILGIRENEHLINAEKIINSYMRVTIASTYILKGSHGDFISEMFIFEVN